MAWLLGRSTDCKELWWNAFVDSFYKFYMKLEAHLFFKCCGMFFDKTSFKLFVWLPLRAVCVERWFPVRINPDRKRGALQWRAASAKLPNIEYLAPTNKALFCTKYTSSYLDTIVSVRVLTPPSSHALCRTFLIEIFVSSSLPSARCCGRKEPLS